MSCRDIINIKQGIHRIYRYIDQVESTLETQINDISGTNVEQLEQDIEDLSNNVATLQTNVSDLSNNVSTYDSQIEDLSNNVSTLDSDLTDLSNNVATHDDDIIELHADLTDLSNNVATHDNDIIELQADLTDLSNNVATLNSNVSDLSNNVASLSNEVNNITDINNDLDISGNLTVNNGFLRLSTTTIEVTEFTNISLSDIAYNYIFVSTDTNDININVDLMVSNTGYYVTVQKIDNGSGTVSLVSTSGIIIYSGSQFSYDLTSQYQTVTIVAARAASGSQVFYVVSES